MAPSKTGETMVEATPLDNLFMQENEKGVKIPSQYNCNKYLLDGEMRLWNGPTATVYSPIYLQGTQSKLALGSHPMMKAEDAVAAVDAAYTAYGEGRGEWPMLPVAQRIVAMERFVAKLKTKTEEIANLIMFEICKTSADATKEVTRTIAYIEDTIKELKNLENKDSSFIKDSGIAAQVRRTPLGVIMCAGPFNYPFNETFAILIPALIMGNTAVMKIPRTGCLCHLPTQELFMECFPKGVVNFIFGSGRETMPAMMQTGKVNILGFIGTSKAADELVKAHPKPHRLRTCLGLEAKNVAVVLPDADLPLAAKEVAAGSLSYNGQRCTALKQIFVSDAVAPKFMDLLVKEIEALPLGMPWTSGAKITPLPEPNKAEYLTALVEDAVRLGAKIVNRNGGLVDRTFFTPAVLFPCQHPEMRVRKEEQFGPVVPVSTYSDISEVYDYLCDSPYGQQASIFGTDPTSVGACLDVLVHQVSRVNLNSQCQRGPDCLPFTARKISACGTLSVFDALRTFSIRSLVANKVDALNTTLVNEIMKQNSSNFLRLEHLF